MPRLASPLPLAAALAVVAALVLGACSDDGDVTKAEFEADLRERTEVEEGSETPEVPDAVITCLTDRIFEDYDQAEVNRIYRAATEDELGNERRDELDTINQECFAAEG